MAGTQGAEAWARLGQKIRESREAQGYSRKKLAELAGVSEKSIQVAEEGRKPRARWPQSLTLIEEGLGWVRGSMQHVLEGGEPSLDLVPIPLFDGEDAEPAAIDETERAPRGVAELLRERPSNYSRSVVLADLPRQIRNSVGEVMRFGRRARNFGAAPDLVEQYESIVEALIIDLANNRHDFEPSSDPGRLWLWMRALEMDPVLRKTREERERAADRQRRSALVSAAHYLGQEKTAVVGDMQSETVLQEIRRLAAEVAQLSQEVRGEREEQESEDDVSGD